MHYNFYLPPLAVALALTVASPVKAAEVLPLQNTAFPALQKKFQLVLPGTNQASLQASNANTLKFVKQHKDNQQISHVRMQQHYAGFPVYGGDIVIHSAATAKGLLAVQSQVQMNGKVFEGLQADLGQAAPDFVKNGQTVLEKFKSNYAHQAISEENVTPLVYMDDNHKAHWAYKVSILLTSLDKIPERPTAIIDARTQKTFVIWNDIKTKRVPVEGMGFGGNQKAGEFQYGVSLPMLQMTRDAKVQKCYMETDDVKVVDMKHRYTSNGKPMEFNCENKEGKPFYMTGYKADGYDKENGAFSPTNDALYSGFVIKHMYHDWYGLEALESNGNPMQLVMRVHYGHGYENAYWDGRQMTFGDGEDMMYPLVSLGVAAHEISHGFTEQHSGLAYYGHSGGMNEAFSDMAAQAAEFYSVAKNTWMIGSEIMKENSGYEALRYMDEPSRDGSSIDSADDYYSGLDVHYSSGVYNRLYYLLSTTTGWNTRLAFDVMVKANVDYWTSTSTFNEGGCGVLSAALDLHRSVDDVKAALTKVGINHSQCVLKPIPIPSE